MIQRQITLELQRTKLNYTSGYTGAVHARMTVLAHVCVVTLTHAEERRCIKSVPYVAKTNCQIYLLELDLTFWNLAYVI